MSDTLGPGNLEHLAPNSILDAFTATRNGIQAEFRRLARRFINCRCPNPWNRATALAWVYPEGIRLVESSRDYYCYGPFAQGDTVKPKNCWDSFQLFLGIKEISDNKSSHFEGSLTMTIPPDDCVDLLHMLEERKLKMEAFKWPLEDWGAFLKSQGTQNGEFARMHPHTGQHVFDTYRGKHWYPSEVNAKKAETRRIYREKFHALREQCRQRRIGERIHPTELTRRGSEMSSVLSLDS